jgi:hypothetical protein
VSHYDLFTVLQHRLHRVGLTLLPDREDCPCLSRNRPHPRTKKRRAGPSLSPTSGKRHCLAGDSRCRFLFVRRWRMRPLAHSRSSIQTRLAAGWASGCSSGRNPGSVFTSTRAASFDPSVRGSSRFRRTRLTSRCMAVTLTDEQAKNMAASLRSGTGALTSIADILAPPVAPTPRSRKWLDPRALRLHRTKAWCLITIPRRDESAPGGMAPARHLHGALGVRRAEQ